MSRILIPVSAIEFYDGGNTIWVHSPEGATVLRIKVLGKVTTERCSTNHVSHADMLVTDGVKFCLAGNITED